MNAGTLTTLNWGDDEKRDGKEVCDGGKEWRGGLGRRGATVSGRARQRARENEPRIAHGEGDERGSEHVSDRPSRWEVHGEGEFGVEGLYRGRKT